MPHFSILLQNAAFDPEQLKQLGDAYDLVRKAMPEADAYSVARAIIGMAEGGITDTATLAARTLDLLGYVVPHQEQKEGQTPNAHPSREGQNPTP